MRIFSLLLFAFYSVSGLGAVDNGQLASENHEPVPQAVVHDKGADHSGQIASPDNSIQAEVVPDQAVTTGSIEEPSAGDVQKISGPSSLEVQESVQSGPGQAHEIHENQGQNGVAAQNQDVQSNLNRSVKGNGGLSAGTDQDRIISLIEKLKKMNTKMAAVEDESGINRFLEQERQLMLDLMILLRVTSIVTLPAVVSNYELNFLKSRILINGKRENNLAVQRDKIKLAFYKNDQAIRDYILYLIRMSRNYMSAEQIVDFSVEKLKSVRQENKQLVLPVFQSSGDIYTALKNNYRDFQIVSNAFQNILTFAIDNPGEIAKTHWFQKMSLLASISYVNNFDIIRPINHKLSPFRVDLGGIVVSFLIYAMIIFCFPLVMKGSGWAIEKYLLNDETGHSELIYRELARPVRSLLVFFSLDVATYALLYKTEYKASLESFAFVIYIMIYVWLLFKLLDRVVIVQINKMGLTNKKLRKELINLGIQTLKGVIVVLALSIALNHFSISITAILSTLGIGGLAFALAAKDTVSNLFGGVTILFDNVFSMGDWVKIGEVEGTVVVIGLRSTTIRTFDNALITIPNSVVSVSNVKNWNRRSVGRRIKLYVGVTYESNMLDIKNALEDIKSMLKHHPDIADPKEKYSAKKNRYRFGSHEDTQGIKSTQLVFMDRYSDFSIDIMIYCFSKTVQWSEWLRVKEDVLFNIADILMRNNLEFAYPTAVRVHRMEKNTADIKSFTMDSRVDSLG